MTTNNGNGENGSDNTTEAEEKQQRQSAYRLKDEIDGEGKSGSNQDRAKEQIFETTLGTAITENLKNIFKQYVVENVIQPDQAESGQVKVNIDVEFLKNHGPSIISKLFESFTKNVIPEKLEVPLGKTEEVAAKKEDQSEDAPEDKEVDVSVNFDLANFVKSLFAAKPRPKPEEGEWEEEEVEEEYEYVEEEVEEEE